MAVSTTDTYSGPYEANGVTVAFPFTFKAVSVDDVAVFIRPASGADQLVDPSAYNVTLAAEGGTVTFEAAPASGNVYVVSEPSFLQSVIFASGQPFLPGVVNEVNDRDVVRALYLKREIERAPKTPIGGGADGRFPVVMPGGGWGFASGTGADDGLRTDMADEEIGAALLAYRRPASLPAAPSVERKLFEMPSITDFGAAGDYNGSEGTDDTAAFQYCIDNDIAARIPQDRNFLIEGVLELRPNFSFIGDDYPGAGDDVAGFPTSRLVFAGSGRSAMVNADPGSILNKGAFANLVITTTEAAQLEYLLDVNGLLGGQFMWLTIENRWTNGGAIRSQKVGSNPTWVNRMIGVNIKIPDASTRSTLDCDWTDSEIVGGNFSGGDGAKFRGNGNMKCLGVQFERARAAGAGATCSKETLSNGELLFTACTFDENFGRGVLVTVKDSPGGGYYAPIFNSCVMRNPNAAKDFEFDPTGAAGIYGPTINNTIFSAAGVTPIDFDPTKWDVSIGDNSYVDPTWIASQFSNTRNLRQILGRHGINLRGPLEVRDNRTYRGMANIAAMFGIGLDDAPMVTTGIKNGTLPFVGASRTAAGVATALALVTDNLERVLIPVGGILNYADDAAAAAGGVPVLGLYRTGSALKIRMA
ncbi:hypothetical protein EGM87_22840 [Sphingobium sp. RSMS]|uniref:hypothetical protein n=1 Tax=Sphingobium sp. RSMS TaxID=520734 RepID=UPI0010F85A3D|nr:hypothetical protein [Sphingobium sp. RSMS]UXC93136.1 hypothetical protein EGM87_22840 [Sphingobium sp. RSMS]